MRGERGFTLVELLVGAAVSAIVMYGLIVLATRLVASGARLEATLAAAAATDRLMERLSSEATGAWSIYRPATDQLGASNADGHELDFYAQDGSHRPYGWAYLFNAQTGLLTRYSFAPGVPGSAVAGETIGTFTSFATSDALPVNAVSDNASPVYDPLFAGANATPVTVFYPAGNVSGGNAVVAVHVESQDVDRTELLASATAPTTFTVLVTYTPSPAPAVTTTPVAPTLAPGAP
jgi:prepilin-type N-terminal cleavage/methylation domain-containing protein